MIASSYVQRALASERARYLVVGGFNTVFGFIVFVAAERTIGQATHYLVALLVAHAISTLVAFAGHRWITFRVHGQILYDLMRFWSVYLVTIAINAAALPVLVEGLGVHPIPAQAVFIVITVIASYLGHKNFSFRRA